MKLVKTSTDPEWHSFGGDPCRITDGESGYILLGAMCHGLFGPVQVMGGVNPKEQPKDLTVNFDPVAYDQSQRVVIIALPDAFWFMLSLEEAEGFRKTLTGNAEPVATAIRECITSAEWAGA